MTKIATKKKTATKKPVKKSAEISLRAWLAKHNACMDETDTVLSLATTLPKLTKVIAGLPKARHPRLCALALNCSPDCESCKHELATMSAAAIRREAMAHVNRWRYWAATRLDLNPRATWPVIFAAMKRAGVR